MVKLSVNINKIGTLRNSRGENNPDVVKFAKKIESYGANGITIHPRPDERHIKYSDIDLLKNKLNIELNVEGYPSKKLINLLLKIKPNQVTLVPDSPELLTSNDGWDVIKNRIFLKEVSDELSNNNIRSSIFVNPTIKMIEEAKKIGFDRVEFYTKSFADYYPFNKRESIKQYIQAANFAKQISIGVNAGHDLNLKNLEYFSSHLPGLLEVSIGHAIICDALDYGMEKTIKMYLSKLNV